MNRKIKYAIGIFSLVIITIITVLCASYGKELTTKKYKVNQDSLYICTQNFMAQLKVTGKTFPDLWLKNDSIVQLSKLPKSVLVFYFSESYCSKCVEKELRLLEEHCDDIKTEIIVLAAFHDYRTLEVFKQTVKLEFPVYFIVRDNFDWELNMYGKPYYFVLDSNMKVSNIFLSDELYPDLSIRYLDNMNNLLTN